MLAAVLPFVILNTASGFDLAAFISVRFQDIIVNISSENLTSAIGRLKLTESSDGQFAVSFDSFVDLELISWGVSLSTPHVTRNLFNPSGFGVLIDCGKCSFENTFPAMQFTASFADDGSGLYLASEDPLAGMKTIKGDVNSLSVEGIAARRYFNKDDKNLTITNFPFRVQKLHPGSDWFTASEMYRNWVLSSNAAWVHQPVRKSSFDNVHFWLNSHWQEYDVFNKSGGDPNELVGRVKKFMEIFNDTLSIGEIALHWYEWDKLGFSDSNYNQCDNSVRCGFDSHYPRYFPARENFSQAVKDLSLLGVKTVPYINGRLFDTGIPEFLSDPKPHAFATKNHHHDVYIEDYGNDVKFAVMCPYTSYWQQTISDVVRTLGSEVPAIYIDEIAAASPLACFDESHGHPVGGGSFWTQGYQELLTEARSKDKSFIIESNVEQFVGFTDAFLSLAAYMQEDFTDDPQSEIVPAFQAVYAQRVKTVGSIFHSEDFLTNRFAKLVSLQFLLGTQIGWMALIGSSNNGDYPSVGMLDGLSKNIDDVEYLKKLINSRKNKHVYKFLSRGRPGLRLRNLSSQIWLLGNDILVLAANPSINKSIQGEYNINIDRYNIRNHLQASYELLDGGIQFRGIFEGAYRLNFKIEPRTVAALILSFSPSVSQLLS